MGDRQPVVGGFGSARDVVHDTRRDWRCRECEHVEATPVGVTPKGWLRLQSGDGDSWPIVGLFCSLGCLADYAAALRDQLLADSARS